MTIPKLAIHVTCALALLLAFGRPAQAQWPTVQMFYGGPLKQPVFVTGADSAAFGDVFRVMNIVNSGIATAATMGDRPYVSVACFWGPVDDPALNGVKGLSNLKPEMAWQHGRFYPATADKPATFFVTSLGMFKQSAARTGLRGSAPSADSAQFVLTGPLPPAALEVLRRLGVPAGPSR